MSATTSWSRSPTNRSTRVRSGFHTQPNIPRHDRFPRCSQGAQVPICASIETAGIDTGRFCAPGDAPGRGGSEGRHLAALLWGARRRAARCRPSLPEPPAPPYPRASGTAARAFRRPLLSSLAPAARGRSRPDDTRSRPTPTSTDPARPPASGRAPGGQPPPGQKPRGRTACRCSRPP